MTAPLVLVTGGTRGIGLACVGSLLNADYDVHVIARDETELTALRSADPGHVSCSAVDLADRRQVAGFCASWDQPIWGLVNNAGLWRELRVDDSPSQADPWDEIMATNLAGPYFLTRGLHEHIVDGGRIVNISSQLGTSGRSGFGAYSASKHAIIGLTRCWALELGPRQVTVNAVAPGWVRTESNLTEFRQWARERATSAEAIEQDIASTLALGRLIAPGEVAAAVTFLLDAIASGITGQVIEIR